MKTIVIALSLVFLAACAPLAPLSPHDYILGDVGEVAWRAPLCLVTVCVSELEMHANWKQEEARQIHAAAQEKKRQQYEAWYQTLSPQEKAQEDYNQMELAEREKDRQAMRDAAALQAYGQMMATNPIFPNRPQMPIQPYRADPGPPPYNTLVRPNLHQPTNCTSNMVGSQVYTNCY